VIADGWGRKPAAAAPLDDRPRPRLTWARREGWCLDYGDDAFASITLRRDSIDVYDFTHTLGDLPQFASLRDAAINLRLRFIATGFDVDDVPAEILEAYEE